MNCVKSQALQVSFDVKSAWQGTPDLILAKACLRRLLPTAIKATLSFLPLAESLNKGGVIPFWIKKLVVSFLPRLTRKEDSPTFVDALMGLLPQATPRMGLLLSESDS
ncbi:hypothetical protein SAMN00120144_4005 [Hymenobacter roseosalivarius DSM 11622]|uniref:Uncharacterized protein n=1 Tax=Hymenobacter roseosalivarius DSM 11622 TaxID=645990 RepID=A0A1W1UHE6_9BACT|nr:hypothetical protein SAMN00120144_4005 [Hymenobacter roseosalivarius DSM 11622]